MLNKSSELIYHTDQQGTPEWLRTKLGKVSGTRAAPLLSDPKRGRGGLSVGCWTLIYKLCREIMDPPDVGTGYTGPDMERGNRLEPFAAIEYSRHEIVPLIEVGFIEVAGRLAGFSADRIIDERKGIEIKCLQMEAHLAWLDDRTVPKDHLAQIQWAMYCAGYEEWDLVHFHPWFARDNGRLDILTIKKDPEVFARFDEAFPLIEANVARIVNKYAPEELKLITDPLQLAA